MKELKKLYSDWEKKLFDLWNKIEHDVPSDVNLDIDFGLYNQLKTFHLGGVFELPYNTQIRFGTSSQRIEQLSQINLIRDILTDTGLGITITTHQYIIDIGTYIYGMGGSVIAFGLGLKL